MSFREHANNLQYNAKDAELTLELYRRFYPKLRWWQFIKRHKQNTAYTKHVREMS